MKIESKSASLTTWLEFARSVVPPSGVIVIGAGIGSGPLIQSLLQWEQSNVMLVEGSISQYEYLQRNNAQQRGWSLHNRVVVPFDEAVTFFQASNPAESGLIDPAQLHALWPHLQTRLFVDNPDVITLSQLLDESGALRNWLLIDCLPAGALLFSAEKMLDHLDLIVARVVLDETGTLQQIDHKGVSIGTLQSWLADRGFRCLVVTPERHPLIAHAVYIRDALHLKAICTRQVKENALVLAYQSVLKQEHEEQADDIRKLREEIATQQEAASRQHEKLQQHEQERTELQQQVATLQQEQVVQAEAAETAHQENEMLLQAAVEREAELRMFLQERDSLIQQTAVLNQDREKRVVVIDTLRQEIEMMQQAAIEREQQGAFQANELSEVRLKLQQQERTVDSAEHRHLIMQQELGKAEAQIDLIRTILLQE